MLDVSLDATDQIRNAIEGVAANRLLRDQSEPAFDLVEPHRQNTQRAPDAPRQTVANGIGTPEYPLPLMRNIVPRRTGSSLLSAEPTYMSLRPGPPNVTVVTRLAGTRI